jgi:hypothetical protein
MSEPEQILFLWFSLCIQLLFVEIFTKCSLRVEIVWGMLAPLWYATQQKLVIYKGNEVPTNVDKWGAGAPFEYLELR